MAIGPVAPVGANRRLAQHGGVGARCSAWSKVCCVISGLVELLGMLSWRGGPHRLELARAA